MREESTYLTADDGTPLFVRTWLPEGQPRAVVQLVHGMAEHSARYARFAQAATDAGYAVVADDHRGHGRTISDASPQGHTHDRDGYTAVLGDLDRVRDLIDTTLPGLPVILMGHSWGSLLVRAWVARHGQDVAPGTTASLASARSGGARVAGAGPAAGGGDAGADPAAGGPAAGDLPGEQTASRYPLAGLIVMGTAADPGPLGAVGIALARLQGRLQGPARPSALLNRLGFASSNKGIEPLRTDSDWLSRDPAEVDAYLADPWCGFTCSAGFFRDLSTAALRVNRRSAFAAVPASLPVLVVSGEADPVGGWGAGVRRVAAGLERAGVRDLTLRLYPGARHELLNETNREEVTADLLAWIGEHVR